MGGCYVIQGARNPQKKSLHQLGPLRVKMDHGCGGSMHMSPSPIAPADALEPCQGMWVAIVMGGELIWEKTWEGGKFQ